MTIPSKRKFKKAVQVPNHLDADALKELRATSSNYLKLDLAYLVAMGGIVTTLKINRFELIEFYSSMTAVVLAYLVVLYVDISTENLFLKEWVLSRIPGSKRRDTNTVMFCVNLQPTLHFIFLTLIIMGGLGFSHGHSQSRAQKTAYGRLQLGLDVFIGKKDRLPKSLDELRASEEIADIALQRLGDSTVIFEPVGKKSYRISITDHAMFRNDEKYTITPELKVYEINKAIEDDEKASGKEK